MKIIQSKNQFYLQFHVYDENPNKSNNKINSSLLRSLQHIHQYAKQIFYLGYNILIEVIFGL